MNRVYPQTFMHLPVKEKTISILTSSLEALVPSASL